MKKIIILLCLTYALLAQVQGQNFAPIDKSIMDVVYFPNGSHRIYMSKTPEERAARIAKIKITYSRPLAGGRKVFGELVKFDQSWRLGANESTEMVLFTPAKIGETLLQPGRYSLYCTPSADKWTLRVHPNLEGWGIFGFDETKDLAKVSANVTKNESFIEAFSMAMYEVSPKSVRLKVGWENTIVEFPIELQ